MNLGGIAIKSASVLKEEINVQKIGKIIIIMVIRMKNNFNTYLI